MGSDFRAFFDRDSLKKLDSAKMCAFLKQYMKVIPHADSNYQLMAQVHEEIESNPKMCRMSLLKTLRPLMQKVNPFLTHWMVISFVGSPT